MTKSEYFEKNNVSFAEAMKEFNEQKKFMSFDEFLASEHITCKFKIGDLVVLQLNEETRSYNWEHNTVFEIIRIHKAIKDYEVKFLTPTKYSRINDIRRFNIGFFERNMVLY